jgi:DNA replication licensing factor MCM3
LCKKNKGAPTTELGHESDEEDPQNGEVLSVYEKGAGEGRRRRGAAEEEKERLTLSFLKKYLHYAKQRIRPKLTKEASNYIANAYSNLRSNAEMAKDKVQFQPYS